MATQRSDDWTMVDMYEALTGKKCAAETLDRRERGEFMKALRAEDTRRRFAEAEVLLKDNGK